MSEDTQKLPDHTSRAHARLGGSSASRWSNCTGSIFLSEDMPPQQQTDATRQGTEAHELAEMCLADFLHFKRTGDNLGRFDAMCAQENCDPVMIDHAKNYRDVVWKEVLEESVTGKSYGLEERVVLDEHLGMFGTTDFWAIYIDQRGRKVLTIGDFKYGYHAVDAKDNAQLAFYAVGFWEFIKAHGKTIDMVRTFIYQPRAHGPSFKEDLYTVKKLAKWRKKFFDAAHAVYVDKKAKFKTGEWCRFCPAQAKCIKYSQSLNQVTSLKLIQPEAITLPPVEALTDDMIGKILQHADSIESFLAACRNYAVYRIESGNKIPGLKLVEGKTRRTWKDDEDEIINALEKMGVKKVFKKKLLPLSSIEKEIGAEAIAPFLTLTEPKKQLVSEDDARPALKNATDLLTSSN